MTLYAQVLKQAAQIRQRQNLASVMRRVREEILMRREQEERERKELGNVRTVSGN